MRFLGAKVVLTPAADKGSGMLAKAIELAETHGWFLTRQFENEANADIHSATTAQEILRDFEGERLDYWVSGYGTGGTVKGVARALKAARPDTKIIVTEPDNSQVLGTGLTDRFRPHPVQGTSPDFIPKLMGTPHSGTFTSACGVLVFGGAGLAPEHDGNVFICEPAQNLVQRQVFRPEGASLRSDPPYRGREFLASTDTWFRPVFLGNGPDGALYVADMHRREVDHPQYVPEDSRHLLDFESGKDRGRIYRIVKAGARAARPKPVPTTKPLSAAELAAGLESPDVWGRDRAHRLLIERGGTAAQAALERIAQDPARPEARVRALWVLHGLRSLNESVLASALRHSDPRVREQGVLLAGERMGSSPGLLKPLLAAAEDADARVRFNVALVLGSVEDASVVPALAKIAARDGEDRWTRAAVLSGIGSRMDGFLGAFQATKSQDSKAFASVMEQLGRMFGVGAPLAACRKFLREMLTGSGALGWRLSSVLGLVEGFRGRGGAKAGAPQDVFAALLNEGGSVVKGRSPEVTAFLRAAAERAANERVATSERVSAVALLGYTDLEFGGSVLGRLLDARQPPELQMQAVRALERIGDPRGGELLIAKANWSRYTPQIREAVIATLTSKPPLIAVLFGAIESGAIAPSEISSTRRTQLMKHADAKVQETANAIFKELEGGDRMKIYQTYRALLGTNTDLEKGREAYVRACSACHTYKGTGGKVGPDLTGVRNQPADALLLHILVPNYEVTPSYQTLAVNTQDGRSITGWLAAETESSLTLRTAFGTEETVLRQNIGSLSASGLSLMPDGLEQTMTKDEVSALIAYLKQAD